MSNSAIPDLISEDIFRFGPGDRYALPIGTAAPDALALSQMAEKCRTRHERLLVICADPLDAVRLGQEARKVRHLSLGEKKRIHGRAADEFLQARRITSASMSSQHGRASIGRSQIGRPSPNPTAYRPKVSPLACRPPSESPPVCAIVTSDSRHKTEPTHVQ